MLIILKDKFQAIKIPLLVILFIVGAYAGSNSAKTQAKIAGFGELRLLYRSENDDDVIQRAFLLNETKTSLVAAIEYKITDAIPRQFGMRAIGNEKTDKWGSNYQPLTSLPKGVAFASLNYHDKAQPFHSSQLIFRSLKLKEGTQTAYLEKKTSPISYVKNWQIDND